MRTGDLTSSIEHALERLGIGLLVLESFEIQYVSNAMVEVLGYDLEELQALDVFDLIPFASDRDFAKERARQRREEPEISYGPLVYPARHKDGQTVHLEVSTVPVAAARILVLARDVTQQVANARRAQQAHKMQAIGQLASGIAHDFNNYLTVVRLLTESMRSDPASARADLDELEKLTEHSARLTQQLMTFGGKDVRRPVVLDINVVVFEMLSMLERLTGERVELVPQLEPGLPPIQLDEGQLQQVVVNLVVNAGRAVEGGGKIFVETSSVPDRDDVVSLEVRDDGIGMEREVLERATEPFFSSRPEESTGMGLAIVYGIVQQSGGSLDIESEPGQGTTVRLLLPVAERPFQRAAPAAGTETTPDAPRVLLVEDEPVIRRHLIPSLEGRGFKVEGLGDGTSAIERINTGSPVDVLVTDIRLPGADGNDVATAFRLVNPEGVIVFVSGYPERFEGLTDGARVEFLRKPFSAAELTQAIEELLAT